MLHMSVSCTHTLHVVTELFHGGRDFAHLELFAGRSNPLSQFLCGSEVAPKLPLANLAGSAWNLNDLASLRELEVDQFWAGSLDHGSAVFGVHYRVEAATGGSIHVSGSAQFIGSLLVVLGPKCGDSLVVVFRRFRHDFLRSEFASAWWAGSRIATGGGGLGPE